FDSSSKIPSGILIGNNEDLGIYDECVSIEIQKEIGLIRGRHCMYSLTMMASSWPMPLHTTLSICLPSACGAQSLMAILQNASHEASDQLPFDIRMGNAACSALDSPPFEVGEILTITIFSIFICFLIGCTICDILMRTIIHVDPESVVNEFCRFSFYTNLKRIFSTKEPRENIPAIQGLRFFSLCWVILGHEYGLKMLGPTINMEDIPSVRHQNQIWMQSWRSIYIALAPFAVDTFFTLSGFLISYLFLKKMAKGQTFNPVMYYLHRYIRLTPAFAALILLTIYIFPRWGSGALWESLVYQERKTCQENWWPMLLYVHNYVNAGIMGCLTHTWYLAVDMQLFWISPLILYPLAKRPNIGLAILVALIVASIISPAVIAAEHEFSGAVAPSLIEIFQQDGYKWNAPWEIFYTAVARHIWAFGVCWLIYASILGYGGIVGRILSLPIFMPFGRISYCVYLIHFMMQLMRIGATRTLVSNPTVSFGHLGEQSHAKQPGPLTSFDEYAGLTREHSTIRDRTEQISELRP
ncbi:nose resistant to fluoxetine protein 6-like, partial [Diachasma alloeum]|uniref:nose resistant to fluoxetine protein 6-like n=1 Tax=Diachasma alloeum TaxID=454923 RepID=UPI0010FADE6D